MTGSPQSLALLLDGGSPIWWLNWLQIDEGQTWKTKYDCHQELIMWEAFSTWLGGWIWWQAEGSFSILRSMQHQLQNLAQQIHLDNFNLLSLQLFCYFWQLTRSTCDWGNDEGNISLSIGIFTTLFIASFVLAHVMNSNLLTKKGWRILICKPFYSHNWLNPCIYWLNCVNKKVRILLFFTLSRSKVTIHYMCQYNWRFCTLINCYSC